MEASTLLLEEDERVVILLGDIGVFAFRDCFQRFPDRVHNVGILEQSMVGIAAGLAHEGLIPVVHSIAPFVVERPFEQIKIDFGYQHLAGNIVSVGASFDYAALGATHHCPGDVGLLLSVPGTEIVVPGTAAEFTSLYREAYGSKALTYFRLSERSNRDSRNVVFGEADCVRRGAGCTIVAVGPLLDVALDAAEKCDATVVYYTTLSPFDGDTLRSASSSGRVLVLEPFYEGTLTHLVSSALSGPTVIRSVGVPRSFRHEYGQREDHERAVGFTVEHVQAAAEELMRA
jgi:transketolase